MRRRGSARPRGAALLGPLGAALALAAPAGAQDGDVARRLLERLRDQTAQAAEAKLDRTGDAETPADREVAREARALLDGRKVTVNFVDTPFVECVDFLRDVTGLNLVVSKAALEALGERTIRLRLREVRLRAALELLLQLGDERLRYGVRHGVLWIGLADELRARMKLVLYDVSDLVAPRPDFPGPTVGLDGVIRR